MQSTLRKIRIWMQWYLCSSHAGMAMNRATTKSNQKTREKRPSEICRFELNCLHLSVSLSYSVSYCICVSFSIYALTNCYSERAAFFISNECIAFSFWFKSFLIDSKSNFHQKKAHRERFHFDFGKYIAFEFCAFILVRNEQKLHRDSSFCGEHHIV